VLVPQQRNLTGLRSDKQQAMPAVEISMPRFILKACEVVVTRWFITRQPLDQNCRWH
jgi:hypothetical protein